MCDAHIIIWDTMRMHENSELIYLKNVRVLFGAYVSFPFPR